MNIRYKRTHNYIHVDSYYIETRANNRITMLYDKDFKNADLSNIDLENTYLGSADLQNTNLSNSILKNSDLSDACLQNANLSYANFEGADLRDANLFNTITEGVNFDLLKYPLSEKQKTQIFNSNVKQTEPFIFKAILILNSFLFDENADVKKVFGTKDILMFVLSFMFTRNQKSIVIMQKEERALMQRWIEANKKAIKEQEARLKIVNIITGYHAFWSDKDNGGIGRSRIKSNRGFRPR